MGEEPHCHQGCQTPRHKYSQLAHFCVRFRKGFQDTKNAFFRILVKLGFLRDDPAQLFTFLCDFHEITGEKVDIRMRLEFMQDDRCRVGHRLPFRVFTIRKTSVFVFLVSILHSPVVLRRRRNIKL